MLLVKETLVCSQVLLNISKIRLYGRYGVGLNNINEIDDQEKWKNQTVQLGVGLAF